MRDITRLSLLFGALLAVSGHLSAFERVFTTPEQRARLDMMRYHSGDSPPLEDSGGTEQAHRLSVEGLLHRGNGKDVVWVNHKSRYRPETRSSDWRLVPLDRQTAIELRLDDNERYTMKPGQALLLDQGRLRESFESAESGDATAPTPPEGALTTE